MLRTVKDTTSIDASSPQSNVTRVVLHNLFHPSIWEESSAAKALNFVMQLKVLLRQSFCVCIISTCFDSFYANSSSSSSSSFLFDLERFCDASISLKTMAETDLLASEYQGYFFIRKPFRINTLMAHYPCGNMLLAFKCKKRNFILETISLPPDLSETVSRSNNSKPSSELF